MWFNMGLLPFRGVNEGNCHSKILEWLQFLVILYLVWRNLVGLWWLDIIISLFPNKIWRPVFPAASLKFSTRIFMELRSSAIKTMSSVKLRQSMFIGLEHVSNLMPLCQPVSPFMNDLFEERIESDRWETTALMYSSPNLKGLVISPTIFILSKGFFDNGKGLVIQTHLFEIV